MLTCGEHSSLLRTHPFSAQRHKDAEEDDADDNANDNAGYHLRGEAVVTDNR